MTRKLVRLFLISSLLVGCISPNRPTEMPPIPWDASRIVKKILVVPTSFQGGWRGDLTTIKQRYAVDMKNYFKEVSYGRLELNVTVTPRIIMPSPISKYRISWRINQMSLLRRLSFVKDAADAIDQRYDLSLYDGLMFAVWARWEALGRTGYVLRGPFRFHAIYTDSGQLIPPADVHTMDSPYPGIPHSLAHILGGYEGGRAVVPDLFDYNAQSAVGHFGYANERVGREGHRYFSIHAGPWDIMSQHGIKVHTGASYKQGIEHQGMSSFTKMKLGWIRPEQMYTVKKGESRKVLLGPLWNAHAKNLVVRLPVTQNHYFLVENRQKKWIDRYLPSEGILILEVDETVPEGSGPVKVVDAHPWSSFFRKAPFQVGEKYNDQQLGITVNVVSKEGDSYQLEIIRK